MFTGSIKISELDALSLVVGADFFPLVQSGSLTTYRIDITTLNNWFRVSGSVLSASWASSSINSVVAASASWASSSINSVVAASASWASASISASYSRSASRSEQALSSSFSSTAKSASYAPFSQEFQVSSSWASSSISASYAMSASYAPVLGDTVPIGTIMAFATSSSPNNWLECNGDAKSTGSFISLYQVISNEHPSSSFGYLCDQFGNRDITGAYFKLPDLRGEFVMGWDNNRGIDIGRLLATLQTASLGTHYHGVGMLNNISNDDAYFIARAWNDGTSYTGRILNGEANSGTTTSINNPTYGLATTSPISTGNPRPRNISLMYCIKYSNSINYATDGATLAGDVVGLTSATNVVAIQGVPITSSAPINGDILTFNSGSGKWAPTQLNVTNGIKAWAEIMWSSSSSDPSAFTILNSYNISNISYINTKSGNYTFYNYGIQFASALANTGYAMIGNGIIFYYDAGDEMPVELASGFHPVDSKKTINNCTMSIKPESSVLFKSGSNIASVLTFMII